MDFFDSGGLSCRLLYRTSGLDGSIHLLLQLIREIFPIIRLNIVSGSSDLRVFVPIADTLPNGLTRVREAGKGRKSYPIIAHGSDLSKPLLLNDLESFKREALKIDPSVTELPFYSHAALLRLPLFARGSFTFLINFWSNEKNSFKEEDIEPLSRLIAPLAEELAAAFTDIPIAVGEVQERLTGYERIRQCTGLAALRQGIEKVAPTRTTVLVTGETGSGKELVAEAIHELSGRNGGPLVRVNCGSIAPTLLESELFGYEKGAFTGAQSRRSGYFEFANGGTLFLDEIGELPLTAQVQLLRVLDRKIIQRVGDPRAIPVDVRVVAATNRDLPPGSVLPPVGVSAQHPAAPRAQGGYPSARPALHHRKDAGNGHDDAPGARSGRTGQTIRLRLARQCQGAGTRSGAGAYRQPFRIGDAPPCFWRKAKTARANVAL